MYKSIWKKFICSLLIVFILSNSLVLFADASIEEYIDIDAIPTWSNISVPTSAMPVRESKVKLTIDAKSVILMEESTGTILYENNVHERLRPASVTKIMSLLLIMEALDEGRIKLTDKVPCSENASKMGGSQIWLDSTEELTVEEMLKAICVVSANDCTVAMAEYIAGSEEAFVTMMNEKAKVLGMNDTTFKNSHGIDEEGHLTSAYDVAIVSRELSMKHQSIHKYTSIWMDNLRDGKSQLVNTNRLVRFYSGATGLKTGSTSLALYNVAATATRNNLKLIAVVMRGSTSQKRFDDAKTLLDYGYANYSFIKLAKENEIVKEIQIPKSEKEKVNIVVGEDIFVLLAKGEEKSIVSETIMNENISAPLEYRAKVGSIKYSLNDQIIKEVDLVVSEKVSSKNLISFLNSLLGFWYKNGR